MIPNCKKLIARNICKVTHDVGTLTISNSVDNCLISFTSMEATQGFFWELDGDYLKSPKGIKYVLVSGRAFFDSTGDRDYLWLQIRYKPTTSSTWSIAGRVLGGTYGIFKSISIDPCLTRLDPELEYHWSLFANIPKGANPSTLRNGYANNGLTIEVIE